MILVQFKCGHHVQLRSDDYSAPICPLCGEHKVVRASAPPPRFSGAASGPCAVQGSPVRPQRVAVETTTVRDPWTPPEDDHAA